MEGKVLLKRSSQLIELSYVSKASKQMNLIDLVHLFDVSYKWNLDHEITGVLFYENGMFSQILEGSEDDVMEVWSKIRQDHRHQVLRQLNYSTNHQRRYPNWALRFYQGDLITKYMPQIGKVLDGLPSHDHELLEIMRSVEELA